MTSVPRGLTNKRRITQNYFLLFVSSFLWSLETTTDILETPPIGSLVRRLFPSPTHGTNLSPNFHGSENTCDIVYDMLHTMYEDDTIVDMAFD